MVDTLLVGSLVISLKKSDPCPENPALVFRQNIQPLINSIKVLANIFIPLIHLFLICRSQLLMKYFTKNWEQPLDV